MMTKIQIGRGLAVTAVLAFTLTARAGEKANVVQLGDLPSLVQQVVTQQAGDGTIQRIVKSPVFYEIDFTAEGVKQKCLVNENGTHSEGPIPRPGKGQGKLIAWTDLPKPVQQLVSEKFHGAPLDEVRLRPAVYSVVVGTSEGDGLIRVAQDGRVLSNQTADELAERKQAEEHNSLEHQTKEAAELEEQAKTGHRVAGHQAKEAAELEQQAKERAAAGGK